MQTATDASPRRNWQRRWKPIVPVMVTAGPAVVVVRVVTGPSRTGTHRMDKGTLPSSSG